MNKLKKRLHFNKLKATLLFLVLQLPLTAQIVQPVDSVLVSKNSLERGLKVMVQQLKKGHKDSVSTWFKANYYQLHKFNLLEDSVLLQISNSLKENRVTEQKENSVVVSSDTAYIKKEIERLAIKLGEDPSTVLPDDFIADVEKYIQLFSTRPSYRNFFRNAYRQSRKYIPALKNKFIEKGLPAEVLYFVMIESSFNPNALSKAGAAGMFQFMPATGRQFGLKVNNKSDERFAIYKSAEASAAYLKELYLELGALNLALAAYNTGSGKVRAALKKLDKIDERNFWILRSKSQALYKETREYIPQIMAVMVLASNTNPEKFGFTTIPFPSDGSFKTVVVSKAVKIDAFLASVEIEKSVFFALNPDLKATEDKTPSDVTQYPLFVPVDKYEQSIRYLQKTLGKGNYDEFDIIKPTAIAKPVKRKKQKKNKPQFSYKKENVLEQYKLEQGDTLIYNVQRANTLRTLSRLFSISEKKILQLNNLRFKSLKRGQQLKLIAKNSVMIYSYKIESKIDYRVLAKQFNMDATFLRKTNPPKGNFYEEEAVLTIYRFSTK